MGHCNSIAVVDSSFLRPDTNSTQPIHPQNKPAQMKKKVHGAPSKICHCIATHHETSGDAVCQMVKSYCKLRWKHTGITILCTCKRMPTLAHYSNPFCTVQNRDDCNTEFFICTFSQKYLYLSLQYLWEKLHTIVLLDVCPLFSLFLHGIQRF